MENTDSSGSRAYSGPKLTMVNWKVFEIQFPAFLMRFKSAEETLLRPRPADLTEDQLNTVRTRRRLSTEQYNRLAAEGLATTRILYTENTASRELRSRTERKQSVWDDKNKLCFSFLYTGACAENSIAVTLIQQYYTECKEKDETPNSSVVWALLKDRFANTTTDYVQTLIGQFNTVNLLPGEKGESLINRMTELKMNLAAYNHKLGDDVELLGRIKSILDEHPIYGPIITALDASTSPATWNKACELIIKKDTKINFKKSVESSNPTTESINYVKVDSKFRCSFHQTDSHDVSECKAVDDLIKAARDTVRKGVTHTKYRDRRQEGKNQAYRAKKFQQKSIKCYNCGKLGHRQADCKMPRKDKSKREIDKSKRKRDNKRKVKNSSDSESETESIRMMKADTDFPCRDTWIRSEFNVEAAVTPIWKDFITVGDVKCEIVQPNAIDYKTRRIPVLSLFRQNSNDIRDSEAPVPSIDENYEENRAWSLGGKWSILQHCVLSSIYVTQLCPDCTYYRICLLTNTTSISI